MVADTNNPDTRWIRWRCGDLDHLNDAGLCGACTPSERVVERWQVACWVASGERDDIEPRWEIC